MQDEWVIKTTYSSADVVTMCYGSVVDQSKVKYNRRRWKSWCIKNASISIYTYKIHLMSRSDNNQHRNASLPQSPQLVECRLLSSTFPRLYLDASSACGSVGMRPQWCHMTAHWWRSANGKGRCFSHGSTAAISVEVATGIQVARAFPVCRVDCDWLIALAFVKYCE